MCLVIDPAVLPTCSPASFAKRVERKSLETKGESASFRPKKGERDREMWMDRERKKEGRKRVLDLENSDDLGQVWDRSGS